MRALLSVANSDGIADLARDLAAMGHELHADPDALAVLAQAGVTAQPVDKASLSADGFDIVVANVRPLAPQVGERVVPLDEAIAMIDVARTSLMAAAAPGGMFTLRNVPASRPCLRTICTTCLTTSAAG